jgi:hypothetical protein
MKLYYHQTDGGAEYYCAKYTTTDDKARPFHINENGEGCAAIMRTDGSEIEIFADRLRELGIKLVIR